MKEQGQGDVWFVTVQKLRALDSCPTTLLYGD